MKQLTLYPIATFLTLLIGVFPAFSQFNIQVRVNSGSATTTCTDPFGLPPNTNWSVNIQNTGWRVYPAFGPCYTALPNVQYDEDFQCYTDVPPTLSVCFRAFDNDFSLANPCVEVMSCMEEICVDLPVPPQGSQNFDVDLPNNLASGGTVNLTITTTGIPGGINDEICNAIDIGILSSGVSVGDDTQSTFNNFCGTYTPGEPDPYNFGAGWCNTVGVWYKLTTTNNPGTHIKVHATSDPSNLGDPINLQVAIFKSSDNTCTGTFSLVKQNFDFGNFDETIVFTCPEPNTTYYILVDGVSNPSYMLFGYYGLEITELGVSAAPELRCNAENLGTVPLGGTVSTPGLRSNACTNNSDPLPASAFTVQRAVWFSFTPPPTGHVLIEGISDIVNDPIGIQLAAYQSSDNSCNGVFTEVGSIYTNINLNESLELHCLDPNKTYYIMVDGSSAANIEGIFSLSVSDAGNETALTDQTVVLCAGESLVVGNSTYAVSGIYTDTIQLLTGCDSIVNTNLTVLPALELNFQIIHQGVGLGNADGQAQVSPTGGAGAYTINWSNGQAGATATGLIGGNVYCVEVTDANNCMLDTCFEMPYYIHFIPNVQGDTLDCFGDDDGVLSLSVFGGYPPYEFSWANASGTVGGVGTVSFDGQVIKIDGLAAGTYQFQMHDIIFDTTFSVAILQPTSIEVQNASVANATCFNECNGEITFIVTGGTPPYQYLWSNNDSAPSIQDLCAGNYSLTVTDGNNCSAVFDYEIDQPTEFIATAIQVQEVSCFQGSDGQASVTTNGSPTAYFWDTGSILQSISNLPGGSYEVTVTNSDGCTATASTTIQTPAAPVGAAIELASPIVCYEDANGSLNAIATGPGALFNFEWNNGQTGNTATNLNAGNYTITVTNEKGCEATASFALGQPTLVEVETSTNQLTCLTAPDDGIITIEQITGGVAPYSYSTDGLTFDTIPELTGYTAGPQVFYIQDAGGCLNTFNATIDGPGELQVELNDDMLIELGETVGLNVLVNQSDVTYQWSPPDILSCYDCPDPVVQPIRNTLFTVTVTDSYGCTSTADMYIEVYKKRNVFVPNAFSPNGDGINDNFVPFGGHDVRVVKEFLVFDRQGNMVFSAYNILPSDLSFGWDGTFKGKQMQPAVFAWFAKVEFIDNETEIFKGDVTLVK